MRGGGGRLPVMPRDRIAPLGAHTSPRQSGKANHGSRGFQPQGCASAGRRADLRAAGDGNGRAGGARRAGFGGGRGNLRAFGRRTAGGSGRGWAKKAAHRELPGSQGCARAPGSRAKPGQAGAPSGRAPGKKTGGAGAKRGVWAGKKAGTAGVGGKKAPLLPRKRRATGLCWGENWRRKLAGRVGLLGAFRESSGGFGGKSWGFEKAFSRAYRKKLLFAPFLCRWRTVIGADNLVVRSGCYLGRKE